MRFTSNPRIVCVAGLACVVALPTSGQLTPSGGENRGGPNAVPLPPIFVPPENPITEEKRVLGKILFWDEQLSSDNTKSCGSCHIPASAGADPRRTPHPGPDGQYGTADDMFTSRGIIRSLNSGKYSPDPVFGLSPQATGRSANPSVFSAFFGELFWDGRASGEFVDPETGAVVIPVGGALESQAVGPVLSDVEMAHQDRDWVEVTAKLERSVPLALARDIPPDVLAALDGASYPDLFEAAFGTRDISASRIGMAIATYERTLIPDQTPWDRYVAGETDAMTPAQIEGWNRFQGQACVVCHTPPHFMDNDFHDVGLRPAFEDIGREGVTGFEGDRGLFKTPTLRNVSLKVSFMHTGAVRTLAEVFDVYARIDTPDNPNRSLFLPIIMPPFDEQAITEFIVGGLTDPRVANETFPFDRPKLFNEWSPSNPSILTGGVPGTGGWQPRVIANVPPNVGNLDFKIGMADALGGATTYLAVSDLPPQGGVVSPDVLEGPFAVGGDGPGAGYATHLMPILARPALDGRVVYMQWRVDDPAADGGVAMSPPVRVTMFCNGPCPNTCPADLAEPFGVLDLADVQTFANAFIAGDTVADLAEPFGVFDLADAQAFIGSFSSGCDD